MLQMAGSFNLIAGRLEPASSVWRDRAFEGANPPGFTLWHCARTIDWAVQCAIRGIDEVARSDRWRSLMLTRFHFGAGISAETAREIAAAIAPGTLAEYLKAVRAAVTDWLEPLDDASLDVVPAFRSHNERSAGYSEPAVWREIEDLEGIPSWQILARPCISHVRTHIGEVDTLMQALGVTPP